MTNHRPFPFAFPTFLNLWPALQFPFALPICPQAPEWRAKLLHLMLHPLAKPWCPVSISQSMSLLTKHFAQLGEHLHDTAGSRLVLFHPQFADGRRSVWASSNEFNMAFRCSNWLTLTSLLPTFCCALTKSPSSCWTLLSLVDLSEDHRQRFA